MHSGPVAPSTPRRHGLAKAALAAAIVMLGLGSIGGLVWWRFHDDAAMVATGARFMDALAQGDAQKAAALTSNRLRTALGTAGLWARCSELGIARNGGYGADRHSFTARHVLRYVVIGANGDAVPVSVRFVSEGQQEMLVDGVEPYQHHR